jgi:hypothetical protein
MNDEGDDYMGTVPSRVVRSVKGKIDGRERAVPGTAGMVPLSLASLTLFRTI